MDTFNTGNTVGMRQASGTPTAPYLFVKNGTNDQEVVPATAATYEILGVSHPDTVSGDFGTTVIFGGVAEVKLGGTVTKGAFLTATTAGVAVATTTAGDTVRAIALSGGVVGDVKPVLLVYFPHP